MRPDASDDRPQDPAEDRPIPLGVALGVMALILVAGAGLIVKYVLYRPADSRPVLRTAVPSPTSPGVAGGLLAADDGLRAKVFRTAAEADLPDGAHPFPGGVLFKAGDAYLRVADDPRGARAGFGFFKLPEAEWEHGYFTQGVRRLAADEGYARELGVSPDQLKRLAALPAPPPARWPDADRDRFLALHRDWLSAADDRRPVAQERLLKELATYATAKRSADQKLTTQRIAAIREILTERQLAKINPIPRWELPATRPSTSPATQRGAGG